MDYLQLGLPIVLLDPDTGYIYTPNTNQLAKMPTATAENITPDALQSEPKSDTICLRQKRSRTAPLARAKAAMMAKAQVIKRGDGKDGE